MTLPGQDDTGSAGADPRDRRIAALEKENARLRQILNTPLIEDFVEAVKAEAAHQEWRWSREHDDRKTPEDWHALIDWLSSKAMAAQIRGDRDKGLHHTISSAAALLHWHDRISREE